MFEIIANEIKKRQKKPLKLAAENEAKQGKEPAYIGDILEDHSITRFDSNMQNKGKKRRKPRKRRSSDSSGGNRKPRKKTGIPVATKRNIVLLFAVMIFTFLTSCSQGEVYYRFHHINKGMWYSDSVLVFKIDTANIHPGKKI